MQGGFVVPLRAGRCLYVQWSNSGDTPTQRSAGLVAKLFLPEHHIFGKVMQWVKVSLVFWPG